LINLMAAPQVAAAAAERLPVSGSRPQFQRNAPNLEQFTLIGLDETAPPLPRYSAAFRAQDCRAAADHVRQVDRRPRGLRRRGVFNPRVSALRSVRS
jgi:hypothetical protein